MGNKILEGTVVSVNTRKLEYKMREVFYMQTNKDLNGVTESASGNMIFLVMFQDWC